MQGTGPAEARLGARVGSRAQLRQTRTSISLRMMRFEPCGHAPRFPSVGTVTATCSRQYFSANIGINSAALCATRRPASRPVRQLARVERAGVVERAGSWDAPHRHDHRQPEGHARRQREEDGVHVVRRVELAHRARLPRRATLRHGTGLGCLGNSDCRREAERLSIDANRGIPVA